SSDLLVPDVPGAPRPPDARDRRGAAHPGPLRRRGRRRPQRGEHAPGRWGNGVADRRAARDPEGRPGSRDARLHGRRATLQCERRLRHPGPRVRRRGRRSDVLPLQRPGRADRLGDLWRDRVHPRGAPFEGPVRRGVAPGGDHGGRGAHRTGGRAEAAARGPRERGGPRARARAGDAGRAGSGRRRDEHGVRGHEGHRRRPRPVVAPPGRGGDPRERRGEQGPVRDAPRRHAPGGRGGGPRLAARRGGPGGRRGVKLFGGPRYPEEVAARVPPGQRLVKGWPVLHYGPIPRFDESTWDFKVYGLVDNPYTLSYQELKALGPQAIPADNKRGFWEVRGYHTHADPWREERYSYQETRESQTEP